MIFLRNSNGISITTSTAESIVSSLVCNFLPPILPLPSNGCEQGQIASLPSLSLSLYSSGTTQLAQRLRPSPTIRLTESSTGRVMGRRRAMLMITRGTACTNLILTVCPSPCPKERIGIKSVGLTETFQ